MSDSIGHNRSNSLLVFANNLSFKEKKVIQDLFKMCDKDGDGEISQTELAEMMKGLGIKHTDKELESMFLQLDNDQSGSITFAEFLNGLKYLDKSKRMNDSLQRKKSAANFIESLEDSQVKQMEELFNLMDANKDGVVNKREMYNIMKQMGQDPTKEEVEELFSHLDLNGDGVLDFKEFIHGMKWLQKGFVMNKSRCDEDEPSNDKNEPISLSKEAKKEINEKKLKDRNIMLENCLKDIVTKGIEVAEGHYINKEYESCQIALNTLDFDSILAMEVFVGQITTEKQRDHYSKMKKRLNAMNGTK